MYLSFDSETEIDLDEDEFDLPTAEQICAVTPVRSGAIKFGPPESESQPDCKQSPPPQRGKQLPPNPTRPESESQPDRKQSPPPQRGKQLPSNPTPPQPEFLEEIEGVVSY